jgi:hypothetical protein
MERTRHIELYHINLADDRDLEESVNQRLNAEPPLDPLRATTPLNEVFSGTFPSKTVHILVKVPEKSEYAADCLPPFLLLLVCG